MRLKVPSVCSLGWLRHDVMDWSLDYAERRRVERGKLSANRVGVGQPDGGLRTGCLIDLGRDGAEAFEC